MISQSDIKRFALAALTCVVLTACGGGGGGSSADNNTVTDNPPQSDDAPQETPVADFNQTVSDLVDQGSTTLPDGQSFDGDSAPIEMQDYMWEIDNADEDQTQLDDVFSG